MRRRRKEEKDWSISEKEKKLQKDWRPKEDATLPCQMKMNFARELNFARD